MMHGHRPNWIAQSFTNVVLRCTASNVLDAFRDVEIARRREAQFNCIRQGLEGLTTELITAPSGVLHKLDRLIILLSTRFRSKLPREYQREYYESQKLQRERILRKSEELIKYESDKSGQDYQRAFFEACVSSLVGCRGNLQIRERLIELSERSTSPVWVAEVVESLIDY